MFTVTHFINKFEAIPEELFTQLELANGNRKCALGHCGTVQGPNGYDYTEGIHVLIVCLED